MAKYVLTTEFKKLNIGMALDEGLASPDETIPVYFGERNVFWIKFHCSGKKYLRLPEKSSHVELQKICS